MRALLWVLHGRDNRDTMQNSVSVKGSVLARVTLFEFEEKTRNNSLSPSFSPNVDLDSEEKDDFRVLFERDYPKAASAH